MFYIVSSVSLFCLLIFVSLSLVSLSLLYKCHLLIKCFIISPFFRSITCAFVSFPSRLPHMAPFLIFSFLCLIFFYLFQPPASGEISQSLLDLCLLNFVFVLFFVKIFPRPFAELSPVIVLFFFVCYVCVFVCFVFTVSTSSMALFAQHQSLLFFILCYLRVCVCVCENFRSILFIFYCVTFDLFLCLLVCLKTAAYVLKDIHNFPHLIFS